MSTRAMIGVTGLQGVGLYRHHDGYPETADGVLEPLQNFVDRFAEVRGNDPEYFFARLVEQQIVSTGQMSQATGFGVCVIGKGEGWDVAYHYLIDLADSSVKIVSESDFIKAVAR